MTPVDPSDLAGDAVLVAPSLLGKLLWSSREGSVTAGRIVEVEAYREDDPASHSFRGPTSRTQTMFGPPGHLYVYLSYGIHRCANVVTGTEGSGSAVLIRALVPVEGTATMRRRRGARAERELANGPGKVCQALGIELDDDGVDVTRPDGEIRLLDDGTPPPTRPLVGPRVGITKGVDRPWRFRSSE